MNTLTRRAALRLSGGVGIGAALTSLGVVRPKTPPALASGFGGAESAPSNILSPFQSLARKALELEDTKRQRSFQGLDPSIQCLRSVSPAMKARIQAVRDEAAYTWTQRLRKKAGWA